MKSAPFHDPNAEPGNFGNYHSSIFYIAFHDIEAETGNVDEAAEPANQLFNQVFNADDEGKWVVGDRIHHRDRPQVIADTSRCL